LDSRLNRSTQTQALNLSAGVSKFARSSRGRFVELTRPLCSDRPANAPTSRLPLRKVLSQQTIGVLIRAARCHGLCGSQKNKRRWFCRQREPSMVRKFLATVPGSAIYTARSVSFLACLMSAEIRPTGYPYWPTFASNHVAGMTFDQGRDIAVVRPGQEIAFPNGQATRPESSTAAGRWTDRDGILDLSPPIAIEDPPVFDRRIVALSIEDDKAALS